MEPETVCVTHGEVRATDIAWLAGLIDGEGYIGAHRPKGRRTCKVRFTIRMTCLKTIREARDLVRKITGHKAKIRERAANDKHKAEYHFDLQRRGALSGLLICLLPYLRTKKEHAECALPILQREDRWRAEIPQWEEELYARLRQLTKTGPQNPEPSRLPPEGVETVRASL